jgi:hypothetical protein
VETGGDGAGARTSSEHHPITITASQQSTTTAPHQSTIRAPLQSAISAPSEHRQSTRAPSEHSIRAPSQHPIRSPSQHHYITAPVPSPEQRSPRRRSPQQLFPRSAPARSKCGSRAHDPQRQFRTRDRDVEPAHVFQEADRAPSVRAHGREDYHIRLTALRKSDQVKSDQLNQTDFPNRWSTE